MTNHPTSEELFAFRDGELGFEKRGLVEAHVLSCSACQARLDEMSDAEGMLRQRHAEPDERYFETLTESVMARVAPGGRAPAARAGAVPAPPATATPSVRPGDRPSQEDEPRGRAPRLAWPAIVSAVTAAAAVVVVVVILFQRQDAWLRAPRPAGVGLKKDAVRETKEEAPSPATGAPSEPAEEGTVAKRDTAPKSGEAPAPVATSPGTLPAADKPEIRPQNAADAMPELALQKSAASPATPEIAERARAAAESQAPAAGAASPGVTGAPGETGVTGVTGVTGESGFPRLASRHGLPLLYDPSTVSSDALLGAEADLRILYQAGHAGEDSARVRLYLAEAARARAGDSPDTETFDTIVHHYQRAVRLARDPDTAKMAMKRLQDFVSTHAPPR